MNDLPFSTVLTILRKLFPPQFFALNFCTNCKNPQIGIYFVEVNHFYRMVIQIHPMPFPHVVYHLYWMQNALLYCIENKLNGINEKEQ